MIDVEFQVGSQGEEAGEVEIFVYEPDISSFGDVLEGLEVEGMKQAREVKDRGKVKKVKVTESKKGRKRKGQRKARKIQGILPCQLRGESRDWQLQSVSGAQSGTAVYQRKTFT